MNAATITTARYSALLVESDKGLGLEPALRDLQCSVRRVNSRQAAQEALEQVDLVVISPNGFSDEDVLDIINRASQATVVLASGTIELAKAQIGQALSTIELKRRVNKTSLGVTAPNSGVVQRRSTPLPKESTPDALEALVEAAEALVPMHRFQRVYVDYALRRFGGNKVHTAAALGIDRRTIQRWARARAEQQRGDQPTAERS